jgi:hypothetical protein
MISAGKKESITAAALKQKQNPYNQIKGNFSYLF